MRIIHIITGLNQGGAESMLEKLLNASKKSTPEVIHIVISLTSLGTIGPRLLARGFEVHALGLTLSPLQLPKLFKLWKILINNRNGSKVQTWMYHADLVGGLISPLAGVGKPFWNLRVVYKKDVAKYTTTIVVKTCALLARFIPKGIICCGEEVAKSHLNLGYPRPKMITIRNGFDLDRFKPCTLARSKYRKVLGIASDDILVGTIARNHPQKDYETMAAAACHVRKIFPNVKFVWIGPDVDTDPRLLDLALLNNIGTPAICLGIRNDVSELLNAFDIFCLTSITEGFPNVIGEAMSCGLPCVATNTGETSVLLGGPRWIAPIQNPESISKLICDLILEGKDGRAAIGSANRNRVAELYDIRSTWMQYYRMYSKSK